MTLQELTRHFRLREQLIQNSETLNALYAAAYPAAQKISGMPHGNGIADKVCDLAIEIADIKAQIAQIQDEIDQQEPAIASFIDGIDDAQLRTILRLRFLRGLTWRDVAANIGGRNTESSVKMVCYRYLSKN